MIPSIDRTRSTRVTVLAVVVLLSALALSMAFTGSAAAAVDSAERNISSTEAPNGTTVTVTVNATFDGTTSQGQINDVISPNISASNVVITDSGRTPAYQESTGTVTSNYFTANSATLTYEVTIPADASVGTTYSFANGTVNDTETPDKVSISGDETITVIEGDGGDDDSSTPDDSPSGDGSIVSAERTIDSEKAIPGDTVGVTVTASFDGTTSSAEITDQISPALPRSNVTGITASGATVSDYQNSTGAVFASWGPRDSATLSYEVTIPESASTGDTYDFSGEVVNGKDTTASVTGNSTIEIVDDPLVAYAGPGGVVGPGGLGDAAADFRAGKIGPGILGDVAAAFRTAKPVV
jgi:hypothetical protein